VFPCALTIGTYAVARKRKDRKLCFYSLNFAGLGVIEAQVENLEMKKEDDWANYPKAIFWAFGQKGYSIEEGMDVLYYGNIPNSSGLSSSASIEVLTGFIIKELFQIDIDMIQIALLSQYAENKFIGVNCGIMDQFSIAMGKKDHAIFLDTSNLRYEYAPIHLKNAKIVIANSNKKRGLGDSKYNERRSECEQALAELQTVVPIKTLGDLGEAEFEKYSSVISNPILKKRAKHAVYENQRTIKAVEALKANDIKQFGQLMNLSHISQRDDYEVTVVEIDTLVEAAWEQRGVIGSRITGGGFGGCTVSIVEDDEIDNFIIKVGSIYEAKIGYKADFYVVDIGNGPIKM
jgi:galactokinase